MNCLKISSWQVIAVSLVLLMAACGGGDQNADVAEDGDGGAVANDGAAPASPDDVTESADGDDITEGADDGARGTFKVALFLPQVGPFAGIAEDQVDGFRHLIDDLNGGVLSGYEVEIVEADTANDPAVAQETLQRLVEGEEVDAVVGVISSAVAYAIAPYLAESGVPTILTAAAADDLTQRQSSDNVFRVTTASSQIMHPMGTYACEELGYETATMLSLDYSFGWEALSGFAQAYEDAGCEVVQELYTPLGSADWGPTVQQIDSNVDVVVQLTTGPDAVSFLQAYRDFGVDVPMLASGFATDPSTLTDPAQRELAAGLQSIMYYAESGGSEANQAFQTSFRAEYGYVPGVYVENTFTAALVLQAALADVDQLDSESLISALADVVIDDSPRGPIAFDENGQALLPVYLREMVEVDGGWENEIVEQIAEEVSQYWTYDPVEFLAGTPYADLRGTWTD